MTSFLIPTVGVFVFLLCAAREADADARSAGQMWAALRRAGWRRTVFTAVRVFVVVVLLILADLCRLVGHAVAAMRVVVEALAVHAEILGSLVTRTEVRA
ncbi:hypothetical protein GBF35_37425 [Nonomuraea phyllanthi]|uniref:hypothetical protein n=1 Tax=Nonomuraea phyllanthi TaxID=2219224 RepID=UPI001293FBFF|nr:hypothetical protein [Nonomuraea phyllanthi]QFY11510.1 hypothetical protein GBF35_37425 [Nonomuraea phyllanthi]